MDTDQYLIGEIANISGLTVRTIRYYMNEGLLPPPEIQGRYAYFDDHYLARLKLIQRLKDGYMPLKEIKRILDQLSDDEIEEYSKKEDISELGGKLSLPGKNRQALEYIDKVTRNQPMRQVSERVFNQPFREPKESVPVAKRETFPQPESSAWTRFVLRKGIELHIDERVMKKERGRIMSIIEHFKRVLRSELQEGRNE